MRRNTMRNITNHVVRRALRAAWVGAVAAWSLAMPAVVWAQGKGAGTDPDAEQGYMASYFITLIMVVMGVAVVARPSERMKEVKFRAD